MIERRDFLKYSLLATSGLGSLALPGCGGGDAALTPATPFTYVYDNPYEVGTPIEPFVPSSESAGFGNYAVSPPLPAGLSLDAATGVITGTPASVAEASLYTVTASGPVGTASASLKFGVLSPALVASAADGLSSRYGHTATLLLNGKVLIVGGGKPLYLANEIDDRDAESSTSAQLYDPVSKTFSDTGSMKYVRSYHTATMLNNGMVLIAGGRKGQAEKSSSHVTTEIYDPALGIFTNSAKMNIARGFHSATLLRDGQVLIAGGNNTFGDRATNAAELYNPVSDSFDSIESLRYRRLNHTATLMPDGNVLIVGGYDPFIEKGYVSPGAFNGTNSVPDHTLYDFSPYCELYVSSEKRFGIAAKLNKWSLGHSTTLISEEIILITGLELGSTKLYLSASGNFTTTGNLIYDRFFHSATKLNNGKVLVAGGKNAENLSKEFYFNNPRATAELYDPLTNTFTGSGKMTVPRDGHTATLLSNGQVLMIGGGGAYSSAELYYPDLGVFGATGLDFEVSVKTKDKAFSGTESDIYLKIIGSIGETGYHNIKNLPDAGESRFQKGDLATFRMSSNMASIGVPKKVQIKFANNGSMSHWFCDYITVTPFDSGVRGIKYKATVDFEFDTDNQVKSFSFPV